MKILSKEISPRTAELVSAIEGAARLRVVYLPVEKRPNITYGVAGTVDVSGESGVYPVWLDTALPPEAFEADVLHELRHIVQVEAGWSAVYNKPSQDFYTKDYKIIQEVGSHLASVVLDIDVNRWLKKMGYQHDFFSLGSLNGLIQCSGVRYPGLNDPINFANVALNLLLAACGVDDTDAARLYDAYRAYPQVVEAVRTFRDQLLAMPLDSQESTCLAHCSLVDGLGLWAYYYVATGDRKIRTHQEYLSFCAEAGFSPDRSE